MNLNEKTVIITGATGGIGEEITKQLGKEGCKLALFARNEKKLKGLSEKINKNTECIFKKCNISSKKDVEKSINMTYKTYKKIDIAILTAGVLIPNPIETFNSNIIKNILEINFLGNVYFIEYLLPIMKLQRSGTIAITSTLCDRRAISSWGGAYGASKAALSWLLDSMRIVAKRKYNINIIPIRPGSVSTSLIDIEGYKRPKAIEPEKAAKIIIKGIKKEKKTIQFPLNQVLCVRLTDLFPNFAYDIITKEDIY